MIVPFALVLMSLAVGGYSVLKNGPILSDMVLLSVLMTVASFYLSLRAIVARPKLEPTGPDQWILVDGSNVMHWKDDTPQLATVQDVLQVLQARGFSPGVIFDANVGYKVAGRYQDDRELARVLRLPEDRVLVVPKGTQADPYLLNSARDLGARVVTNDKYRDWAADFPEIRSQGFLISGGYRGGKLWLDDGLLARHAA